MAEQVTISRPAPYLEAAGEKYLDVAAQLAAQPVDVSAFAPTIAGQGPLAQAAQQAAATQAGLGTLQFDPTTGAVTGVGTGTGVAGYEPFLQKAQEYMGPSAYQAFESPYQEEVIGATLSEFDKQRQIAQQQIAAQAIGAGAFGGGREGVQLAEFGAQSLRDRALLEAQLRSQGFAQAQSAAAQAQAQAQADATREATRMAAFQPQEELNRFADITTGIMGGMRGTGTTTTNIPNPTPLQTALGVGTTLAGIYGGLTGKFTTPFQGT